MLTYYTFKFATPLSVVGKGFYIDAWSRLLQVGYREKAREEASRGGSQTYRPDIALATEVSKLTSLV